MKQAKPNVAFIIGSLSAGGAEKWATDHINTSNNLCNYTLYCLKKENQIFKPKCKIVYLKFNSLLGHFFESYRLLKENKDLEIIHCNLNFSAWIYGIISIILNLKLIAHWHNDTRVFSYNSSCFRKLYYYFSRIFIAISASKVICVSKKAEESFLENNFISRIKKNTLVIFCGTKNFKKGIYQYKKSNNLRLGHFGRFVVQKNHIRLIEIFNLLKKYYPSSYLNLYGEGPLEEDIKECVNSYGLSDSVRFMGVVNDVKRIMYEDTDVFVLPSYHEGLPIVCMEAHAVGLKTIVSSEVSQEIYHKELTCSISLKDDNSEWVKKILESFEDNYSKDEWIKIFSDSKFNIANNSLKIINLYKKTKS